MALRLGIDIDGVLADFRSAFQETARRCLKRELAADGDEKDTLSDPDLARVWKHVARTANWWMRLEAYEPAEIANLYSLARAGGWEVYFLTRRPPSAGDTVQFQTQWWLEQLGFFLPSVITVPGSRGDLASALRLDVVIDDQFVNCAEVVGAGPTKAVLMLREPDDGLRAHAIGRGIGVVSTLAELTPVLQQLHEVLRGRRPRLIRLSDWFTAGSHETLPHSPRFARPLSPPNAVE